jgi:hypothetical protein
MVDHWAELWVAGKAEWMAVPMVAPRAGQMVDQLAS